MSALLSRDRTLVLLGSAWMAALLMVPELPQVGVAFFTTIGLIAVGVGVSFHVLTHTRQVLIVLSCTQIALYGFLNYQLYRAFDEQHFRCDREPRFCDWIEFTVAHVFRAADFLDALDEHGISIQTITHQSASAGLLLVCMHLTVDAFLLGLLIRWLSRRWSAPPSETYLQRGRREFAWLLAAIAVYVVFAACQGFRARDWLLWPLDNLLRVLDIGDCLQIFGWRLHGVEPTYWTRGGSLMFRAVASVAMARVVIWMRTGLFRTWGQSVEELIELLDDPDADVRRAAAEGIGRTGRLAQSAAPSLVPLLGDLNLDVRRSAAEALGRIGGATPVAVARLVDAVWLGHPELRVAAAKALAEIGIEARPALHSLVTLLKVSDVDARPRIAQTLEAIAPGLVARMPKSHLKPLKRKRRRRKRKRDCWERALKAAEHREHTENVVRTRLFELCRSGFFDDDRDVRAICAALADTGLEVQSMHLCLPLLRLTSQGLLSRQRDEKGDWAYRRMPYSPLPLGERGRGEG